MNKKLLFKSAIIIVGLSSTLNHSNAQDGALDKTFNKTGTWYNEVSGSAFDMEVLEDGKTLLVGNIWEANSNFGISRLNADGTLDLTFGNNGKVMYDFGDYDIARAVGVQSDGKIVVAGSRKSAKTGNDWAVIRLHADGTVDSTFANNGEYIHVFDTTSFDEQVNDLIINQFGKIYLVGSTFSNDTSFSAIISLNSNGSLDDEFGQNGVTKWKYYGEDEAFSIDLQSDGKIIIGGKTGSMSESWNVLITRLSSQGKLDQTFGVGGYYVQDLASSTNQVKDIYVLGNNEILFATEGYFANGQDFILGKLSANGLLESTFGTEGFVVFDKDGRGQTARAIAVQNDGKILVTGEHWDGLNNLYLTLRLSTAGVIDSTFGTNGYVLNQLGTYSFPYNIEVLENNKILIGGSANSSYLGAVRLIGTCSMEPTMIYSNLMDSMVCEGADVKFLVQANNSVAYQWQKLQSNNSFSDLINGVDSILNFYNTTTDDQGTYRIIAYHECGLLNDTVEVDLLINTINTLVNVQNDTLSAVEKNGTYQWFKCGNNDELISGATASAYKPSTSGEYRVLISKAGCSDTSACYKVEIIGVENVSANELEVFPNPFDEELVVKSSAQILSLEIYNSFGQLIHQEMGNQSQQQSINFVGSEGIYNLKVYSANGVSVHQLVKK